MSGFVGYISNTPVNEEHLQEANRALIHRGPDDSGLWISGDGKIGLAHRRLSVIDLSGLGRQPMSNRNKSIWIVHSGEVYNFKEIREELNSKGYAFISNTDAEVILQAYAEWGEGCLNYFRGVYSFAICDPRNRTMFVATDRVGKEPLYYFFDGSNFAFASELKALTLLPFFKRKINPSALADYLSLGYIPAPKSIWAKAHKLLSGESLHYDTAAKAMHKRRYWEPEFYTDESKNESYWLNGISESLYESVKLRMISDVPLGALLSGGVDSSAVVAVLTRVSESPRTFTISFRDRQFDETAYATKVARAVGSQHKKRVVSASDAKEIFDLLLWHYDEPFNDYS